MWKIEGIATYPGITIGYIMHMRAGAYHFCHFEAESQETKEKERFLAARQVAEIELTALETKTADEISNTYAEFFEVQKVMMNSLSFAESVLNVIGQNHISAEAAVEDTINEIVSMLMMLDDDYMLERAENIKDVGNRLLRILEKIAEKVNYMGIFLDQDLLPFHNAVLELDSVSGFYTSLGSNSSHKSILAKDKGIPTVAGVGSALEKLENGDRVIIDGHAGRILVNPEEWVVAEYRQRMKRTQNQTVEKALGYLSNGTSDDKGINSPVMLVHLVI